MYMNCCAQTQKTFSLLGGSPSRETEFYVDFLVLPLEPNCLFLFRKHQHQVSTSASEERRTERLYFIFDDPSLVVCANRFLPDCSSSVVSLSDSGSNSCGWWDIVCTQQQLCSRLPLLLLLVCCFIFGRSWTPRGWPLYACSEQMANHKAVGGPKVVTWMKQEGEGPRRPVQLLAF